MRTLLRAGCTGLTRPARNPTMEPRMAAEPLELLADLIARARAAGADAADAVLVSGTSLSVSRRLGKTEHVERSEGRDLGLRVFLGQQVAIVSSSTMDPSSFKALAERAVAMARVV